MFQGARVKLTMWYLLIIMFISITFSAVIYKFLSDEVDRFARIQRYRIERRLGDGQYVLPDNNHPSSRYLPPPLDPDLVNETKSRILLTLLVINAGIFFVSGGLAYFLAGRTLGPIKLMIEEQNRFISDASHELRTPLTSLKTSIEVGLRDKKLTLPNAKNLITTSLNEVNKLQLLADELLQVAQYEKPDGKIKFEIISTAELIKESIDKVKPLAQQKRITIQNKTEDFEIEGNKYALIDLLLILLDNAIKYSPDKSTISIHCFKSDRLAIISVKDQGIGIEKDDLPHIFDRFYQADSARSKAYKGGYGLGLSIAKKIVENHKGKIEVKSKSKAGSTFTIQLPLNKN